MAISFPRPMPAFGLGKNHFEIRRIDYMSPEGGGRIGAVTAGFPLWEGRWPFAAMNEAHSEEMRAWVSSLRGPQRLFLGMDQARRWPLAYPGGSHDFLAAGGEADDWSVNGDRDVLELNGVPSGFQISIGDQVGFKWETGGQQRRALVRCLEADNADGGGQLTVTVEPAVPGLVPPSAIAYLSEPTCLMRLTGDTELGDSDLNRSLEGVIAGVQELLP